MKQKEKLKMWYQVESLRGKNLNKSQIARELGIDRGTVRKYLLMSEEVFLEHIQNVRRMPKKLKAYYGYVEDLLKEHPYLSAAQVEDRLKEKYDDLPKVHSKTVFNFVHNIRRQKGIPKPKAIETRQFEQIPPTPYGQEAQVDFGERWMKTVSGSRIKVNFMAMVLSRSRYKHVYFTDRPFTSQSAIKAHQLAFDYFQGVPKKILYDQDKVFIHDEYGGDVVLTAKFKRYIESESCKIVFCRKADPQTKGKVENVVKYVKNNFISGRNFHSLEQLNEDVLKWLDRTANAKKHGSTQKIPKSEWLIEKESLLAVKSSNIYYITEPDRRRYKVRKDNTIAYKRNFYTVPTGTYVDKNSSVWLEMKNDQLNIFDADNESLIATHMISILKGKLIRNNDHLRDKQSSMKDKEQRLVSMLGKDTQCTTYLHAIHSDKPRYYHDHLREILKILQSYDVSVVKVAMHKCLSLGVLNAYDLRKMIEQMSTKNTSEYDKLNLKGLIVPKAGIKPIRSDINTYEFIMKQKT
ncbi:MAG: IS21 family transposase [Bacteroidota bacterium]